MSGRSTCPRKAPSGPNTRVGPPRGAPAGRTGSTQRFPARSISIRPYAGQCSGCATSASSLSASDRLGHPAVDVGLRDRGWLRGPANGQPSSPWSVAKDFRNSPFSDTDSLAGGVRREGRRTRARRDDRNPERRDDAPFDTGEKRERVDRAIGVDEEGAGSLAREPGGRRLHGFFREADEEAISRQRFGGAGIERRADGVRQGGHVDRLRGNEPPLGVEHGDSKALRVPDHHRIVGPKEKVCRGVELSRAGSRTAVGRHERAVRCVMSNGARRVQDDEAAVGPPPSRDHSVQLMLRVPLAHADRERRPCGDSPARRVVPRPPILDRLTVVARTGRGGRGSVGGRARTENDEQRENAG